MTTKRLNRRSFLQTGTAIGAAAVLSAPNILRARNLNGKLNVAMIGSGGRGAHNLRKFASENIVALCDVNENKLNAAAKRYPHYISEWRHAVFCGDPVKWKKEAVDQPGEEKYEQCERPNMTGWRCRFRLAHSPPAGARFTALS